MRFTLTISFVLLITCAIAAPVAMAPNPGDLTLVKSTDLLNQGPNTKPNAVFDANGDKVRIFFPTQYNVDYSSCLYVQRDGRGRPHPGVVTDGPGPKNDYGIALVSHKLPTDAFPHQADAHKLNPTLFQPDTTINVGKPVRAKQANMNPKNVPLGSLSGSELQRLHDKIGMQHLLPLPSFSASPSVTLYMTLV